MSKTTATLSLGTCFQDSDARKYSVQYTLSSTAVAATKRFLEHTQDPKVLNMNQHRAILSEKTEPRHTAVGYALEAGQ